MQKLNIIKLIKHFIIANKVAVGIAVAVGVGTTGTVMYIDHANNNAKAQVEQSNQIVEAQSKTQESNINKGTTNKADNKVSLEKESKLKNKESDKPKDNKVVENKLSDKSEGKNETKNETSDKSESNKTPEKASASSDTENKSSNDKGGKTEGNSSVDKPSEKQSVKSNKLSEKPSEKPSEDKYKGFSYSIQNEGRQNGYIGGLNDYVSKFSQVASQSTMNSFLDDTNKIVGYLTMGAYPSKVKAKLVGKIYNGHKITSVDIQYYKVKLFDNDYNEIDQIKELQKLGALNRCGGGLYSTVIGDYSIAGTPGIRHYIRCTIRFN